MIYLPNQPGAVATIGNTGTTIKKFQTSVVYASGPLIGTAYPYPGTSVTDYLIPVAGGVGKPQGKVGGRHIRCYASGNVYVHGTSPTLNFQLIGNLGNTPATDVVLATLTSAQSLTTATSYDWTVDIDLYGCQAPLTAGAIGGSGSLQVCSGTSFIGSTISIQTAMTLTALTSVNFQGAYATSYPAISYNAVQYPAFFLKFGLIFGVSDAANLAQMTEFYATDDQ